MALLRALRSKHPCSGAGQQRAEQALKVLERVCAAAVTQFGAQHPQSQWYRAVQIDGLVATGDQRRATQLALKLQPLVATLPLGFSRHDVVARSATALAQSPN